MFFASIGIGGFAVLLTFVFALIIGSYIASMIRRARRKARRAAAPPLGDVVRWGEEMAYLPLRPKVDDR